MTSSAHYREWMLKHSTSYHYSLTQGASLSMYYIDYILVLKIDKWNALFENNGAISDRSLWSIIILYTVNMSLGLRPTTQGFDNGREFEEMCGLLVFVTPLEEVEWSLQKRSQCTAVHCALFYTVHPH